MLYLFKDPCKGLNIPPTNNHLEGMFEHIKEYKNSSRFG
jgi:hypothetical protein